MQKELKEVRKVHDGKYIKQYEAKYVTDNGEKVYEITSRKNSPDLENENPKPDAVRILPYFYDEKGEINVVLIHEFRYAINRYIYGVPAGLIDKGEEPIESAKRELAEEIGAKVISITQTEKMSYSSAGLCDESLVCFEAEVKLVEKQKLDRFEDITVLTVKLDELEKMLNTEEFGLQSRLQLRGFIYEHQKRKKKIGAFVGKFLPPHIGHLSIINRVLRECDEVIVVLSDNPDKSKKMCEDSNFPYFSSKKRLNWIKKHYKNEKNIKFYIIDERKMKKTPFDMEEYSNLFWSVVKDKVNVKYADESYRELNEKFFKTCDFVAIDRDLISVHGTDIREDLDKIKFVVEEGQKDILKKLK